MRMFATAALLQLCLYAAAAVSDYGSTETALTAAPGDIVLLPCYTDGTATPSLTEWMKNGEEIISAGDSSTSSSNTGQHLAVQHDGSLSISGVIPADEGTYLCNSTLPGNIIFRARVVLQVASGPENLSTHISPTTALSNGTLVVYRGSNVSFNCSSSSYPSQQLTWAFKGASGSNESLDSSSGSWLSFSVNDIQPSAQGVYRCTANNTFSHQAVNQSTQLLVYYVSDRHPDCMWAPAEDPSHVLFTCSWFGSYPLPTLRWEEDQVKQVYASEVTDSLTVKLNRSLLSEGQTLRCTAQHAALAPGTEKSCLFTLKSPYPEGEPLATAQEADSVTLTCSEATSFPPANTTWRKGLQQEVIVPGSKYILTEEGPVLKLTIHNVSKDDEGVYFCRSENPLTCRELEVYLTVRTSSAYTGAVVGIFIAVLIVGLTAIIAKTVYSSRHRICLGGGFG
ncbi:uncharacterized protein V6R79_005604 [Siganus canaliculatus]